MKGIVKILCKITSWAGYKILDQMFAAASAIFWSSAHTLMIVLSFYSLLRKIMTVLS